MSCTPGALSPCGTWELRHVEQGAPTDLSTGYGTQMWSYQLIERATGAVIASWHGIATSSPWDACSSGVSRVRWDGDMLLIEHCPEHLHADSVVERVPPATLSDAYSATDT